MRTIEQLLGDLLLRNNCVIIPSFGGFVARQISAKIDYASGKMYPPAKSLLFNKQLINNDGLLINELSQANAWSYDIAAQQVQDKVGEWKKALASGSRIELDRIGYLFYDAERNLCFEQDRFFNLLLESFGLGQVHFLTEEDVKITEHRIVQLEINETADKSERTPDVPQPIKKLPRISETVETVISEDEHSELVLSPGRKKVWRYIAAACILPIAFYSIWIPMRTDVLESGVISIHDFNPFRTQTEGEYRPVELNELSGADKRALTLEEEIAELDPKVQTYTYAYNEKTNISVKIDRNKVIVKEEKPDPVQAEPAEHFAPNAMHFIVGCFGDKTNAENLVSKLKAEGMDAGIVDFNNGLHRVSAGGALSTEAFEQLKAKAQSLGYQGWVLK